MGGHVTVSAYPEALSDRRELWNALMTGNVASLNIVSCAKGHKAEQLIT
jgi:hypothetical protein